MHIVLRLDICISSRFMFIDSYNLLPTGMIDGNNSGKAVNDKGHELYMEKRILCQ